VKYIKEYKIFESSDVLWCALSHQEFNEIIYPDGDYVDGIQSLSQQEIKYLETIGDFKYIDKVPYGIFHHVNMESRIFIFKLTDEWYYITNPLQTIFYKCDTFQGLKQLIDRLIESRGFAMRIAESIEDDDTILYHEVSETDWNDMVIKDGINFTDLDKVVSSINDLNIKDLSIDTTKWENGYDKYNIYEIDCLAIKLPYMDKSMPEDTNNWRRASYYKEVVIYQLPDEYFALTILIPGKYEYYKCDTLDGLIQALKIIKEQSEAS
jgi:hypothetical protein